MSKDCTLIEANLGEARSVEVRFGTYNQTYR